MTIEIHVENYRAFANLVQFEVRPLTLFFGYNSAGKSALLRLLPLFRDSIAQGEQALSLQSPCMRDASFSDLLSKHGSGQSLRFGIRLKNSSFEYVIRYIPEQRAQVVESLSVHVPGQRAQLTWAADPKQPQNYVLSSNAGEKNVRVEFAGLFVAQTNENDPTAIEMSAVASAALKAAFKDVYWLQALRAVPPRKEVVSDPVNTIGPDGSGITQLLYHLDQRGSDVLEAISDWYLRATGFKLIIERGAFSSRELISFRLDANGQHIELADTGEGIGQVLPIVGLLHLALRGAVGESPVLVFEHPELHLHAAAEPALAALICEVASSGKASVIAETHSESFLLALQLALIQRRLKSSDVGVYWVRQPQSGPASLVEIEFDDYGLPREGAWPVGLFSEKTAQAREVVLARRRLNDEG